MGILDGLIGGAVGAAMTTVINDVLQKNGGVGGLVKAFESKGLGGMAQSWVGKGANQALTPDQVHHVFGADTVRALAAKVGVDPTALAQQIAQHLPTAVDKLTPDGVAPKA
ncbi:MAG: YidB family protein [Parvularculaceae bacterium]|nr:YidB family protein [Parvularculaceae bacterium]